MTPRQLGDPGTYTSFRRRFPTQRLIGNVLIRATERATSPVSAPGGDGHLVNAVQPAETFGRSTARPAQRVVAMFLLLLALPVLIGLVVAIRLDSPGPALFRQKRVGLNGQPFTMFKLRTMFAGSIHGGRPKVPGDDRVTQLGRSLRRLSLDEIPQLLNVVRGDMALIGPRPLMACDVGNTAADRRRLQVLPGMTGLWQVSGRCTLGPTESLLLDVEYVDNWSHRLDASIVLRTPRAVFRGFGAY